MIDIRYGTAQTITVGPFLDTTDGKTPETALTATNEHCTMIAGTTLVIDADLTAADGDNDFVHITDDDAGYYTLELTVAQTSYLGPGKLSINYVTDHIPAFHELNFMSQEAYDLKYGARKEPGVLGVTTIFSVTSQTELVLSQGLTDDDACNNMLAKITDQSDENQIDIVAISDYDSYTESIILLRAPIFTVANGDKVEILITQAGIMSEPSDIWAELTSGLTTSGSIGKLIVDYLDAAITSRLATAGYTAPDNSSITDILTDTNEIQGKLPTNNIMGSSDKDNHDTDIDSILEDTGTTIPALIAALNDLSQADIRTAIGLASANLDTQLSTIAGYIDTEVTSIINAIAALNDVSAAEVNAQVDAALADFFTDMATLVDAIWDELVADHAGAGSAGAALAAAGGSGDPWATALPGAYSAGTAGKIIGDYLDAAISSRLAAAGYTAPDNTNIGNIYNIVNSGTYGLSAIKTLLDTMAGYIDTEVASILEDTGTTIPALIAALNDLSAAEVNAECDTAISDAALATAANLAATKAVVDAVKIVTDVIATMYEDVTGHRWTEKALEQAPGGAGGDATEANQTTIIGHLTDIKGITWSDETLVALKAVADAIKTKTDNLPSGIKKGVALNNFEIFMTNSDDHISGKTGLTVSGYIAKDGGSFAAISGSISEKAYGVYTVDSFSETEMNADIITLRFTATGADPRIIVIKTVA
jgi:hypothetical protein